MATRGVSKSRVTKSSASPKSRNIVETDASNASSDSAFAVAASRKRARTTASSNISKKRHKPSQSLLTPSSRGRHPATRPSRNPSPEPSTVTGNSYIVTTTHHMSGERDNQDRHVIVGSFPTEKEGMLAAKQRYLFSVAGQGNDWRYDWEEDSDEMRLAAIKETGETDAETFTVTVKKSPRQHTHAAQRAINNRHVFLVQEERRYFNAEDDDFDDCDLHNYMLHGLYRSSDDANRRAQDIYYGFVNRAGALLVTAAHETDLVSAVVARAEEGMGYKVWVERREVFGEEHVGAAF